jgi:O-acetylhomoserine/O-acetylserine sulfhydrylase-like pyridoxal-dependent enzyme
MKVWEKSLRALEHAAKARETIQAWHRSAAKRCMQHTHVDPHRKLITHPWDTAHQQEWYDSEQGQKGTSRAEFRVCVKASETFNSHACILPYMSTYRYS